MVVTGYHIKIIKQFTQNGTSLLVMKTIRRSSGNGPCISLNNQYSIITLGQAIIKMYPATYQRPKQKTPLESSAMVDLNEVRQAHLGLT